jgi:membrane protease YdiL (CAAX protease family)
VIDLLRRAFDYRRIRGVVWYVPIFLLMPAVSLVAYALMRLLDMPLPTPQFPTRVAALMFLAFLAAAMGEELGWSGYAIDPMQERWSALQAGILLGLVGALWHIVPLLQANRSPAWIAWWCLYAVAARVLIVWLYNNTGRSVLAAALCHAMLNMSWMLFPVYGSHFDPRLGGLVMASAAALVTLAWGARTLARYRDA